MHIFCCVCMIISNFNFFPFSTNFSLLFCCREKISLVCRRHGRRQWSVRMIKGQWHGEGESVTMHFAGEFEGVGGNFINPQMQQSKATFYRPLRLPTFIVMCASTSIPIYVSGSCSWCGYFVSIYGAGEELFAVLFERRKVFFTKPKKYNKFPRNNNDDDGHPWHKWEKKFFLVSGHKSNKNWSQNLSLPLMERDKHSIYQQ